ncbi:MAG: nucleotidyltransferase family protein, partial [Eubacteriales bacterium]
MKVVGIIAEYNPFHNGHLYQLEEAKRMTGADYVIVVMSGNYTQRGVPSFLDKYTRTEMALQCGADLVLELPVYYACASAQYFARGAVDLLHAIGVVDVLSFGSECGEIQLLEEIAIKLQEETSDFSETLQKNLRCGYAYPKAFSNAFIHCYPKEKKMHESIMAPNNLLGIEYLKALHLRKSSIQPTTIKREGSQYLDESLTSTKSSALAIRSTLSKKHSIESIQEQVPQVVLALLKEQQKSLSFIETNDFSQLLALQLRVHWKEGYTKFADVSEGLSNRMQNQLIHFHTFEDFCSLVKTKEYTYARISRCLL